MAYITTVILLHLKKKQVTALWSSGEKLTKIANVKGLLSQMVSNIVSKLVSATKDIVI